MPQPDDFNLGPIPPDQKDDWAKNADKALSRWTRKIVQILTKGLRFEDNFDFYIGSVTTDATPGNQTTIAHGLKRIPNGVIVCVPDKVGTIYQTTVPDVTNIYLKGSVASITAKVIVF